MPPAMPASRSTAARVTFGAISFSNSSHLALRSYSNLREAGGIATWLSQAVNISRAYWISGNHEHDWEWSGLPAIWLLVPAFASLSRTTSGLIVTSSAACLRCLLLFSPGGPTRPSICTFLPSVQPNCSKALEEMHQVTEPWNLGWIGGQRDVSTPKVPYALCLLRALPPPAMSPRHHPNTPRNSRRLMLAPSSGAKHRIG